jgi:putative peptidoglycan lipid II flippase
MHSRSNSIGTPPNPPETVAPVPVAGAASLLGEEAVDTGQGFPSFNGSADTPDVTSPTSDSPPESTGQSISDGATAASQSSGKTRKAALLVTGSTGISALIGIANALISARLFGISRGMDAYLVAVLIPQMLGFVFGIRLSVFLVPWLISVRHTQGKAAAKVLEWRIALGFPVITALLLGVCYAMSQTVVDALAPGFGAEDAARVVSLLKWTIPGGVAVVAMAILTSIAHSHHRFWGASISSILNPLATFILLVIAGRHLQEQSIAMGFFFGPLAGCLPILWSLRGAGADAAPAASTPEVPHFGMVMLLGVMTTAHNQVPLLVSRYIASFMPAGVITGLQYASTFSWMPVTILAISVGTALLPAMAEKNASKTGLDATALEGAARAIRVLGYLLVPLAFVIFFFSFPVVSLALSGGQFDKEAVLMTSGAMQCYAPLIWMGGFWGILLRVVQARNALNVIFEGLLLGTIADVLIMMSLTDSSLGYRAIPLASSVNYLLVMIYILVRTRHDIRLPLGSIGRCMAVLSLLALGASGVTWLLRPYTLAPLTGLIYASTYVALAWLFKVHEQRDFWELVLGRGLNRFRPKRA